MALTVRHVAIQRKWRDNARTMAASPRKADVTWAFFNLIHPTQVIENYAYFVVK